MSAPRRPARGGAPAALAETGLTTNPVHVLDLSLLLLALAVAGSASGSA